jgi:cell shape-determining protein MreC
MAGRQSATIAATPKNVIGLSVLFLMLAAIFGLLNNHKVKVLRANMAHAEAARAAREQRRAVEARNPERASMPPAAMAAPSTPAAATEGKVAEAENKAAKAEADLGQVQKEKADLQSKLDANQAEIASLRQQLEAAATTPKPAVSPVPTRSPTELQAQLDDVRHQLDGAEKEKAFLSEKLQSAQERTSQPQEEKKRKEPAPRRGGVRGTILAVNQAYNFVVLNLGARQGVEPNSEMLVVREGTLIGRIRISTVEPATAIGDIITSSLARGVQVQPGDTVIYAGTSS